MCCTDGLSVTSLWILCYCINYCLIMSSKSLTEEERKKYEKEFSELLIQRITHAGGSLQFHHLSGLLQQARFEIRDAFGTTKSELMKFLKSHANIFQIDSVGIVTINSLNSDDPFELSANKKARGKEIVPTKIEKGVGTIKKIHPEFGIIKATEPIETQVHFKSQAFFGKKESLLSDSCLEIGDEVYFEAVLGHDDYDIKFRATKVWQKRDGSEVSADKSHKQDIPRDLNGEGVIQKLCPDIGFISVLGEGKKMIFFHRSSVRGCGDQKLTNFFNIGNTVEFFAIRTDRKDSKYQWQATDVRKKLQNVQSPKINIKTKLVNEAGKIYPHSDGAVIKFGKGFTQQVDGQSSHYFLYGAEVSDTKCIQWEFSEGDDVLFDAVKSKSGWKAVVVWVGEKPTSINNEIFSGNKSEFPDDESCASLSNISSASHYSRPSTAKSQSVSRLKDVEQNERKSVHYSVNRKLSTSDRKFKNNTNPSFPQNFSKGRSRNRNKGNVPQKDNSLLKRKEKDKCSPPEEREVMYEPRQKKPLNKNVLASCQPDVELDKISDDEDNFSIKDNLDKISDDEDNFSIKDNMSDSSLDSFQNHEFSNMSQDGKYLVKEKCDKIYFATPRHNFSDTDKNNADNVGNEIKSKINTSEKKASIRKCNDIDGKIINLYCKAAIIESSRFQNSVDFVLNAFYVNGKSVEEQQVIDLKEIINVGDIVKFNCFEIVDDFEEVHQKVTMAWIGPKPEVYEMTPEEFIDEHELSVTLRNDSASECLFDETTEQNYFAGETSGSTSSDSSLGSRSDDETFKESGILETNLGEKSSEEDDISLNANNLLSERINQRLKNKSLIPFGAQVDFCSVLAEITSLVQKHCDRCNSATLNETVKEKSKTIPKLVCSTCAETVSRKNTNKTHTAVQTIITGGVIAQR